MDKNLSSPKVSIFMAAFNAAKFIEKSIKSVLNQSFQDFELIIVDDGSTDETKQIIELFTDERIKLFSNESNMGLMYTRNRMAELATAPFIAILDSDDITHRDRITLQYEFLTSNPEFGLCGGQAHQIDIDDHMTGHTMQVPVNKAGITTEILFGNPFINSSTMFRKDLFLNVGGYRDYAPAEDYDLFVRMSEQKRAFNLPEVLIDYRVHATNISKTGAANLLINEKRIISHMLTSLGVSPSEENVLLHFEIFSRKFVPANLERYYQLFSEMKVANQVTKRYDHMELAITLHKIWYEVLMHKIIKANALFLLTRSNLFCWKAVTFKQIRKTFKKSLRNIL